MYKIIGVTNRNLCKYNFLNQVEKFVKCGPEGIILREKDMDEDSYKTLAAQVMAICEKYEVTCILHSFVSVALELGAENIHLPLHRLKELDEDAKVRFKKIGASCHSVEEAALAEKLGCTYVVAGHIFATDCKKGLPPRGIEFLSKVCEHVSIPVYGIGGIDATNISKVMEAGAQGACIMSSWMKCENDMLWIGGKDEV